MDDKRDLYPEFMRLVDQVTAQNPFQRKKIVGYIGRQDAAYWQFAETLSRDLRHSFWETEADCIQAAQSYNQMCMEILREEIRFRKTGVYLLNSAATANEMVYSRQTVMRDYLIGLLLSYLFWPNHYQIISFFKKCLSDNGSFQQCLEVGAGHGIFTAEVMRFSPQAKMIVVDISQTSIDLTRQMLNTFQVDETRVQFVHDNFLTIPSNHSGFDFVIMGEVLEHVNDAPEFMRQARTLLQPGGKIFMTTCANCPAIDHIYHFHSVPEIRDLIDNAHLTIVRELVLPVNDIPESQWREELTTINYAALLTPSEK